MELVVKSGKHELVGFVDLGTGHDIMSHLSGNIVRLRYSYLHICFFFLIIILLTKFGTYMLYVLEKVVKFMQSLVKICSRQTNYILQH